MILTRSRKRSVAVEVDGPDSSPVSTNRFNYYTAQNILLPVQKPQTFSESVKMMSTPTKSGDGNLTRSRVGRRKASRIDKKRAEEETENAKGISNGGGEAKEDGDDEEEEGSRGRYDLRYGKREQVRWLCYQQQQDSEDDKKGMASKVGAKRRGSSSSSSSREAGVYKEKDHKGGGAPDKDDSTGGGGDAIQAVEIDDIGGAVSFDDVGGLSEYIKSLKEMVFLPLLYPHFFASYSITPPRGVLLCGPPGTGKTLIARALACAASKAAGRHKKVSFYMRKGADVLSKWAGESEAQLKLLFEEARRNQPSIIFFDEIDGLAPVRSIRQEQVNNSIVSTLLALMDGLDSRGQVVLIGATNRVDAIDGALRRPGRFDREFNFALPDCEARAQILAIHTRKWKEPPSNDLKLELAAASVGYCGADLKALCTEAALRAFRERHPHVYSDDEKKLSLVDVDSVRVEKHHFLEAMAAITPAAHKGSIAKSRPLSPVVLPCLQRFVKEAVAVISDVFVTPAAVSLVYKPRLLLRGDDADGIDLDHVVPAVLYELEKFLVHSLAMPSLLSDPGAKTADEALVHAFREARRSAPSILYLPQFQRWWESAHEQLKVVLQTLLGELPCDLPILLLGTSSIPLDGVPTSIFSDDHLLHLSSPSTEDRSLFIEGLIEAALWSVESKNATTKSSLLPKGPNNKVSELRAKAEAQGRLRKCLRDVCNRILKRQKFRDFYNNRVVDQGAIIQNPMDIATLLQHIDSGKYITLNSFKEDFNLIATNAQKYNKAEAKIVKSADKLQKYVHDKLSKMESSLVTFCDRIGDDEKGKEIITVSNQLDSIKKLLLERAAEYNFSQLERLYTSIMKGIFQTKRTSHEVKDVKASILRFLFEFAKDQSTTF